MKIISLLLHKTTNFADKTVPWWRGVQRETFFKRKRKSSVFKGVLFTETNETYVGYLHSMVFLQLKFIPKFIRLLYKIVNSNSSFLDIRKTINLKIRLLGIGKTINLKIRLWNQHPVQRLLARTSQTLIRNFSICIADIT